MQRGLMDTHSVGRGKVPAGGFPMGIVVMGWEANTLTSGGVNTSTIKIISKRKEKSVSQN